eukprot:764018-Hanusia_phi.AAC.2
MRRSALSRRRTGPRCAARCRCAGLAHLDLPPSWQLVSIALHEQLSLSHFNEHAKCIAVSPKGSPQQLPKPIINFKGQS